MKISYQAERPHLAQTNPEAQVEALWRYIQAKAPGFTLSAARDVVARLDAHLGETPKVLAKRLRTVLQGYRVALKHTNALHAASHLSGFTSWHNNSNNDELRLRFVAFDADLVRETFFRSWDDLASELRNWSDRLLGRGQLPLGVLTLNFSGDALNLCTPVLHAGDGLKRNEVWPLGTITSAVGDVQWLKDAPAALEKLRRHLEEPGHAVLDGYAVVRLCATSGDRLEHPTAVGVSDVVNSELVLMREDDEDEPGSGYEIARGDELSCWHQLELSLRKDATSEMPTMQVTIPKEGAGAWHVKGARYVWELETLKPQANVPGRVSRQIGIADCERLLRRYRLAKCIHGKTFKHHEPVKQVDYLGYPPEVLRIDLHFLQQQLNNAGLTWESYIAKFNAEPLPMAETLPIGFIFQLLQDLQIEQPRDVFAKPTLAEMERVDDDALLRALVPRVDHVRYVMLRNLDAERADALREAVKEFADELRMQKVIAAGALPMDDELPHLVWANATEELRLAVEALGLVMYVATVPYLHSTKGILPEVEGIEPWPWAFGNAFFFRFVGRPQ
jgi:hypothetical protein